MTSRKSYWVSFAVVVLALVALIAPMTRTHASTPATYSTASLSGKYLFQLQGVMSAYGYNSCSSSSSCSWTDVVNGATCPSTENCVTAAYTKYTYGYLEFDGNGNVTYVAFTEYHPAGGPGPTTNSGTGYGTYTVASSGNGFISLIGGGGGASFYINIANVDPTTGIAGSMLVHEPPDTGDPGSTESGFAFHQ
jgi:Ca2+-binding RTX toxin-like protein